MSLPPVQPTQQQQQAQQQALQQVQHHLDEVQKILSNLPEPYRGAIKYALDVAGNPKIDRQVCLTTGKVVTVTLNFNDKDKLSDKDKLADGQVVSLLGDKGALGNWDVYYNQDPHNVANPRERTFTFSVPASQMDDVMKIKAYSNGKWMEGNDWSCHLKTLEGHHVSIGPLTVTGWEK